jgi:Dyp-type peroxidase family
MPIALDKLLRWPPDNPDEIAMLDDLQGNILKSHGRDHAVHMFLRFDDIARGRMFVRMIAGWVTSARQQLVEIDTFKLTRVSAGEFVAFFLSAAGYKALEVPEENIPSEPAFRDGMRRRGAMLADPPAIFWDTSFQEPIHAMALIADGSATLVRQHTRRLQWAAREHAVRVAAIEFGHALKNDYGLTIEHFGYADGLSVPVLISKDPPAELKWNPEVPLAQALVPDPGAASGAGFGSYLVFRKIEQNVRAFKEAEQRLAQALGLQGEEAERAGALLVGRFEGGSPLALSDADDVSLNLLNDFSYADDPEGRRCPFHAHIRKVNPRGASTDERSRLLVRRGITYGRRYDDPNRDLEPGARPSSGVGLLFMAYGSGIESQFEFVQARWANDPHYLRPHTGIDPLIGQQAAPDYQWPVCWGADAPFLAAPFSIGGFTSLKGGEYFFAPCISALKSL